MRLGGGRPRPRLVTVIRPFKQHSTIDHFMELGAWIKPKAGPVRAQATQPFHLFESRPAFLFARQRSSWDFLLFHQSLHEQPSQVQVTLNDPLAQPCNSIIHLQATKDINFVGTYRLDRSSVATTQSSQDPVPRRGRLASPDMSPRLPLGAGSRANSRGKSCTTNSVSWEPSTPLHCIGAVGPSGVLAADNRRRPVACAH